MKYKLELIEDCRGIIYGAVINEHNEVVYFAGGFQHYVPWEIDDAIVEVAIAEEFDWRTWEDCIPDPHESYEEFMRLEEGYTVIYDGVYFHPERMGRAALSVCGYTEYGERMVSSYAS